MAVVGAPAYFTERKPPKTPQGLTEHDCTICACPMAALFLGVRRGGREVNVRVDGQLVFGTSGLILAAARAGLGLAYPTEEQVSADLKTDRLARVLADWCPPFSGYHFYYPTRRQPTKSVRAPARGFADRAPAKRVHKSCRPCENSTTWSIE